MNDTRFLWQGPPIDSWAEFHRLIKLPDRPLLARLGDYVDSVLVAGCQRSGTTALTRLLKRTKGVADYRFGPDDELDGALLLAGYVERFTYGKHCFQTTYVNDRFAEYFDHDRFRLVWILREPAAVVYSMLHNWRRAALNRLFDACGQQAIDIVLPERSSMSQWIGPSRLDKACASYIAKTEQTLALRERLGERMLIVDYDDLVIDQERLLPEICHFTELPFQRDLLGHLHRKSIDKGRRLSEREADRVRDTCVPVYRRMRRLRTIGAADD